jgi:DNA-directed RNA polymerase subunit N (RpoN/RPB10)
MVGISVGKFKKISNHELMARGMKPRLGHTFERIGVSGDEMAHDFRCPICGRWIAYDHSEIERFIKEGRWDFRKGRLLHCGNSTCQDYQELIEEDKKRQEEAIKEKSWGLYMKLKGTGLVA